MAPTYSGCRNLGLWTLGELEDAFALKKAGRPYEAIATILRATAPGRTCQQVREAIHETPAGNGDDHLLA